MGQKKGNWKITFSVEYANVISSLKTVSYLPKMQLRTDEYKNNFSKKIWFSL
jgi:hypothetical protein